MRRQITAGFAILAVVAGVGWKLASHQVHSTGLQDIRLLQHSEHSHPGPNDALAGVRIRLSVSDFDQQRLASAPRVPRIAVATE